MNFIPVELKIVLVEFVLVETVLVGDPLYLDKSNAQTIEFWKDLSIGL